MSVGHHSAITWLQPNMKRRDDAREAVRARLWTEDSLPKLA